jgi:anti-anti-sigma factor
MESFSGGEFGVDFVHSDGEALVLLSGELDVATAPVLREHLAEFASQGLINISVDLSALRFIDSVGLSVFVAAQKHLARSSCFDHLREYGSFFKSRPWRHSCWRNPSSFLRSRTRPLLGYLVLGRDVDTCDENAVVIGSSPGADASPGLPLSPHPAR